MQINPAFPPPRLDMPKRKAEGVAAYSVQVRVGLSHP